MDLFTPVTATAAIIEPLPLTSLGLYGIEADILRLDKIHPVVSGNKWFKLKYHLQEALRQQRKGIVTFGGAFSNHIVATAYAAKLAGLESTGIIRGEAPAFLSHTLKDAASYGMQLVFTPREAYRNMTEKGFTGEQATDYAGLYYIPEGGAGELGERGSSEILALADIHAYTHIICAIGTATMFTGLANGSRMHQHIIGVPVLKGMENLAEQLKDRINATRLPYCHLLFDYHFGGYAKKNKQLFAFMNECYNQTGVPTDFVYTGKLLFAVDDLIKKNYFPSGSRLLVVHSGGLQGNLSLPLRTLQF
jgi:1-aminocyclopropane-1-carboxylate deaminase